MNKSPYSKRKQGSCASQIFIESTISQFKPINLLALVKPNSMHLIILDPEMLESLCFTLFLKVCLRTSQRRFTYTTSGYMTW